MKKKIDLKIGFLFLAILMILVPACKKKQAGNDALIPGVTTLAVTNITASSAQSGGNCTENGAVIVQKGVCWSTLPAPTTDGNRTSGSGGTGDYVSMLTGLTFNTLYYIRAYATNRVGTGYGKELTFRTLPPPDITTARVTEIAATSARSGGFVLTGGGQPVTARGLCWGTSPAPTLMDDHSVDGTGTGVFVSQMHNLTPNTRYYARAYATTADGTFYGNEVTFDDTYYIGSKYGGGTVFYLDSTGVHGLVAANNDQGASVAWGCEGVRVGTAATIGSGRGNTTAIVLKCNTGQNAALLCDALVLNGYSDWFLPSKDELNEMFLHRDVIGGFPATPGAYWNSTEFNSTGPEWAWLQWFNTGEQLYALKQDLCFVRAARAF